MKALFFILLLPAMAWGQDDLYGKQEPKREKADDTPEIFQASNLKSDSIEQWVYCQIVGTQKFLNPNKLTVEIDYGQKRKWWSDNRRIRDDEGDVKEFNSMIDALNYMGTRGWQFVQAYTVTLGSSNVYHWLLRADARSPIFIPDTKK